MLRSCLAGYHYSQLELGQGFFEEVIRNGKVGYVIHLKGGCIVGGSSPPLFTNLILYTMTLWRIDKLDIEGRRVRSKGIFAAPTEDEARELAAQHYGARSIADTGYFRAVAVDLTWISQERERLRKELMDNTEIMN